MGNSLSGTQVIPLESFGGVEVIMGLRCVPLLGSAVLTSHGGVYAIVCEVDGRAYIGSARAFGPRWKRHLRDGGTNSVFRAAVAQYGWPAFRMVCLEVVDFSLMSSCERASVLCERENLWMNAARGCGVGLYNATRAIPNFRMGLPIESVCPKTLDVKRWESARAAGIELGVTPSSILAVVNSDDEAHQFVKGLFWRRSGSSLWPVGRPGRRIAVNELNPLTGEVLAQWDSLGQAAASRDGLRVALISHCCHHAEAVHGGSAWAFAQNRIRRNVATSRGFERARNHSVMASLGKPVEKVCPHTRAVLAVFPSISAAAYAVSDESKNTARPLSYRAAQTSIRKMINLTSSSGRVTVGGFIFRPVGSDWFPVARSRFGEKHRFSRRPRASRPVRQILPDGRFIDWPSQVEAAAGTGCQQTAISKCCRGALKSTNGHFWSYAPRVGVSHNS